MRVIFAAYRKWAFEILNILIKKKDKDWQITGIITTESCEINIDDITKDIAIISHSLEEIKDKDFADRVRHFRPDIILFYGWSWMVRKNILEIAPCVCLHPSPLPKYRGGSPIQNQIIAGEEESAVTLFLMTQGIDNGCILAQKRFSLEGELSEILERIVVIGAQLTENVLAKMLNNTLCAVPQEAPKMTVCKRRKPGDSEITQDEIRSNSARYIYNKIRALQSPYPNAYIVCGNGKKIYLTKAHL